MSKRPSTFFTKKATDSNYDCVLIYLSNTKSLLFFSYVRVIQNDPPTPVRNSKYLAIPPTHSFTLT